MPSSRSTTPLTVARNDASCDVPCLLWTISASDFGCFHSSARTACTWPDSPLPALAGSSVFVPTTLPIMNAATTNASQPNVAVFQWRTLQRPTRPAMLLGVVPVFMWTPTRLSDELNLAARGRGHRWATLLLEARVFWGGALRPSGPQEHQHRQDAARLAARRGQPELVEDARRVLLDGARRDIEAVGDPLVRATCGHQLEHVALARGEGGDGVVR